MTQKQTHQEIFLAKTDEYYACNEYSVSMTTCCCCLSPQMHKQDWQAGQALLASSDLRLLQSSSLLPG